MENRATTLSNSGVAINDTGSKGFYSEEETSKKVREPEGAATIDEYADESERHPLAHEHVAKIRGLCAERRADAKFLCVRCCTE
jgi:hypothetical protein